MNISMQILLKRALLLFGASMLAAIVLDAGLKSWDSLASRSHGDQSRGGQAEFASQSSLGAKIAKLTSREQLQPWNGGKPQPQVGLSAELNRINADIFEFTLQIEPQEKCTELTVEVTGLDGVSIVDGSGFFLHDAPCSEGVATSVRVRVPDGIEGFVSVQISLHAEEGTRSFSRAFAAANPTSGTSSTEGSLPGAAQKASIQSVNTSKPVENTGELKRVNNNGGGWVHDIEVE